MGFFSGLFGGGDDDDSGTDWGGIVSTGLSLYDEYTKGQAASGAYKTEASNAKANAKYEKQLAVDSNERGSELADKFAIQGQRYEGKQMAAEGASGVVANSGSFQQANQATRDQINMDTQTIMRNTMREAYGHTLAAESGLRAADAYTSAASSAQLESELNMAGTILTGDYSGGMSAKWWE